MTASLDHYAVFGHPIAHSKSPLIHRWFAQHTAQSMDYQAKLVPLDGFAQAIAEFAANGGQGANVTLPFKIQAFDIADVKSERARIAGAVNTLSFRDGKIFGDNTDGIGLVRDIRVRCGQILKGRKVLMLGAGGAARGALLPILDEQVALLHIANRSVNKAQDLIAIAREIVSADVPSPLELAAKSFDELDTAYDIIINATSASISDQLPEIPALVFSEDSLAYDMMYGDHATPFMCFAERNGARAVDGLGMLLEQAAEAFLIWRGIRPETEHLMRHLRQAKGAA